MSYKIFIYDVPAPSNVLTYGNISAELERLGGKRVAYSTWEVYFSGSLIEHMRPFFDPSARLLEIPHDPAAVTVQPGKYELPTGLPYRQLDVGLAWLDSFYDHPTSKRASNALLDAANAGGNAFANNYRRP